MKFVLISFSFLFCSLANAEVLDSIKVESIDGKKYIIHKVDEKETLYGITRRYQVSIKDVAMLNKLENNQIDIAQLIRIPLLSGSELPEIEEEPKEIIVEKKVPEAPISNDKVSSESGKRLYHEVNPGETLYRISKMYNTSVDSIKVLNNLTSNNLDLGMKLLVKGERIVIKNNDEVEPSSKVGVVEDYIEQFDVYLVQTGETLKGIASKLGNKMDSIKLWNNLDTDFLSIGQKLRYKKNEDTDLVIKKKSDQVNVQVDEKGFEKVYEEGLAGLIEDMNTKKYYALHKTLPIGSDLEVRNIMNNRVVHVKVIGKLPKTGLNKKMMLRLSQPAFDQLGILDRKSRVEVSYFK